MLLEDTRVEAREVFTEKEVGFFSDEESLNERLRYFFFDAGKSKVGDMVIKAYTKVATKHTYLHRMTHIKNIIE
jgi:spore maturation protein CgeB